MNYTVIKEKSMPLKKLEEKESQQRCLLDVGKKLMLQYGIKKTTIDEIVDLAQIAKGTFYLYFSSKEDFFYKLIVEINQQFFQLAESTIIENINGDLKQAIKKYFEILFNSHEISFYFREHKQVGELVAKFSKESFTDLETSWINKLLLLGNIDINVVHPETVHNFIHLIYLAKCSDLLIEEYRDETVSNLINVLVDYIFRQTKTCCVRGDSQ